MNVGKSLVKAMWSPKQLEQHGERSFFKHSSELWCCVQNSYRFQRSALIRDMMETVVFETYPASLDDGSQGSLKSHNVRIMGHVRSSNGKFYDVPKITIPISSSPSLSDNFICFPIQARHYLLRGIFYLYLPDKSFCLIRGVKINILNSAILSSPDQIRRLVFSLTL